VESIHLERKSKSRAWRRGVACHLSFIGPQVGAAGLDKGEKLLLHPKTVINNALIGYQPPLTPT